MDLEEISGVLRNRHHDATKSAEVVSEDSHHIETAENANGSLLSVAAHHHPNHKSDDDHDSDTANESIRCVICLDTVTEPCIAQPCAHRHFDFLCLASWLLQRQPSCPLCKATVATVQYGWRNGTWKTFPVPAIDLASENTARTAEAAAAASTVTADHQDSTRIGRHSAPASALARGHRYRRRAGHRAPSPPPSADVAAAAALERRRRVYRHGLYACHVGANRYSRCYRELTPQLFARDPDLVARARAFLRRELQVFWGPGEATVPLAPGGSVGGSAGGARRPRRTNNTEFLLEYIVAILQTVDLQHSSGQAETLVQAFLGRRDHTRHFLHELRSFLRSPYLTLASWDRHVQYGPPGKRFRGADDEEEQQGEEEEENGEGMTRPDHRETNPKKRHLRTGWARRGGGDSWRPSSERWTTHRRHGRGGDNGGEGGGSWNRSRSTTPPSSSSSSRLRPPHRQRRHEAALQEACRRYDPS